MMTITRLLNPTYLRVLIGFAAVCVFCVATYAVFLDEMRTLRMSSAIQSHASSQHLKVIEFLGLTPADADVTPLVTQEVAQFLVQIKSLDNRFLEKMRSSGGLAVSENNRLLLEAMGALHTQDPENTNKTIAKLISGYTDLEIATREAMD
ncbi:MAG: hypothetical protein AAGF15_06645, partial [Pseudomonadota bacterium]